MPIPNPNGSTDLPTEPTLAYLGICLNGSFPLGSMVLGSLGAKMIRRIQKHAELYGEVEFLSEDGTAQESDGSRDFRKLEATGESVARVRNELPNCPVVDRAEPSEQGHYLLAAFAVFTVPRIADEASLVNALLRAWSATEGGLHSVQVDLKQTNKDWTKIASAVWLHGEGHENFVLSLFVYSRKQWLLLPEGSALVGAVPDAQASGAEQL